MLCVLICVWCGFATVGQKKQEKSPPAPTENHQFPFKFSIAGSVRLPDDVGTVGTLNWLGSGRCLVVITTACTAVSMPFACRLCPFELHCDAISSLLSSSGWNCYYYVFSFFEQVLIQPFHKTLLEAIDLSKIGLHGHTCFTRKRMPPQDPEPNTPCYTNSVSVSNDGMLILGKRKIVMARLMNWSERVETFLARGRYVDALGLALDFYEGKAVASFGLPQDEARRRVLLSNDMIEHGLKYVEAALKPLLLKSESINSRQSSSANSTQTPLSASALENAISSYSTPPSSSSASSSFSDTFLSTDSSKIGSSLSSISSSYDGCKTIAHVAMDYYLCLDRADVLFGQVFDLFTKAGVANALLGLVESYVLARKIKVISPEAMSAFVSLYKAKGKLERVERVILTLDIQGMDLHQLILLCREYRMFSALIHLYNAGLQDYKSPVTDIIDIVGFPSASHTSTSSITGPTSASSISTTSSIFDNIAKSEAGSSTRAFSADEKERIGFKLLLYIQYSLQGRVFPSGECMDELRGAAVRAQILSVLFQKKRKGAPVSPVKLTREEIEKQQQQAEVLFWGSLPPPKISLPLHTNQFLNIPMVSVIHTHSLSLSLIHTFFSFTLLTLGLVPRFPSILLFNLSCA